MVVRRIKWDKIHKAAASRASETSTQPDSRQSLLKQGDDPQVLQRKLPQWKLEMLLSEKGSRWRSIGVTLKRIPSLYFPLPQVMRARGKPGVQWEPQLLVRSIPEILGIKLEDSTIFQMWLEFGPRYHEVYTCWNYAGVCLETASAKVSDRQVRVGREGGLPLQPSSGW